MPQFHSVGKKFDQKTISAQYLITHKKILVRIKEMRQVRKMGKKFLDTELLNKGAIRTYWLSNKFTYFEHCFFLDNIEIDKPPTDFD